MKKMILKEKDHAIIQNDENDYWKC